MINLDNTVITGTTSNEIIQNINNIITTPQGTVPLDRNFGIDISILDEAINLVPGKLTVELVKKIQLYEPRVKVKEVTFTADEYGNLIPKVRVEL